ncbi:MAG: uridine kinase [Granulosicoccaceae bacterium]
MQRPRTVIGIAGPSGSGKSTLCQYLQSELGDALTLVPEDAYYRDLAHISMEDRKAVNYDHPNSLEHDLLAQHLAQLKRGEAVEAPVYDFATHTRRTVTSTLPAAPLIVVEGILLLAHPPLREQLDIKIYLETDNATCLSRRIERDIRERGREELDVRRQYSETVEPMLHEFVLPSREHADLLIPAERNNTVARSILLSHLQSIC